MPPTGAPSGADPTAAQLRRRAAHILAGYRHHDRSPQPLAGVLHAIGHGLDVVVGPVGRFLEHRLLHPVATGFHFAFGPWWPLAVAVVAVLVGAAGATLLVRGRSRPRTAGAGTDVAEGPAAEDPRALEAQAEAAEAAGSYGNAVRLRFRAGLARLERDGVVVHREVLTGRQLASELRSVTFDRLSGQHEAIAFGGRPATAADAADARAQWPRVPAEARDGHAEVGP